MADPKVSFIQRFNCTTSAPGLALGFLQWGLHHPDLKYQKLYTSSDNEVISQLFLQTGQEIFFSFVTTKELDLSRLKEISLVGDRETQSAGRFHHKLSKTFYLYSL